ncbi:MAG TPA: alpha/beta fold hydrolase [Steroidobacteraceae bacterium]|nr:alpha/beta fold hydrolase [Steroidobacteraceae bacterium]
MKALLRVSAACLLAVCTVSISAQPKLVTEEFMLPTADAGISIYVRNKHPASLKKVPSNRVLLYVHGATYPSETAFDLELNGLSWMDYIAERGYDVYLVDVRGYGKSTRPTQMDQPPEQNEPIARTEAAVKDVGTAVDFILKRRGVKKLDLLGWSWGTVTMGWYTAQHNDRVDKLVLLAPLWLSQSPRPASTAKLGAYRTVTRAAAKARWLARVPPDKQADLIPAGWFDAWADATFATDPVGNARTPPVLRAPNGVMADNQDFWGRGMPIYDPAEIRVPTLLAHAEWDADLPSSMFYAYFGKLVNTPYKRAVQIGEGTHTIMLEKNRMQLFQEVQQFLDDTVHVGQ